MVIGSGGAAAIGEPGRTPALRLAATTDHERIVYALRHLTPALDKCTLTAALLLAAQNLRSLPEGRTRAILAMTKSTPTTGDFAQGVFESAAADPVPIFQVVPNRTQGHWAPAPDPGAPPQFGPTIIFLKLRTDPIADAKAFANLFRHHYDYGYDSGGLRYKPADDDQLDQALARVGSELRAVYRLYYTPDNLTKRPAPHAVRVELRAGAAAPVATLACRHAYLGVAVSAPGH